VATAGTALLLGVGAGCGSPERTTASDSAATTTAAAAEQRFPDILSAELTRTGDGTVDVEVTVSSPYDSPQRYADGWRVLAPDGAVLGEHTLLHDHAGEQPFTRTQTAVPVPDGVTEVTVEGRDQVHGYGGGTVTVEVPQP
jgi:hypothetical protein